MTDTTADRCYRHQDRQAGVSCQRCGRAICPSCMATAQVGFHCPECVSSGKQKVITRSGIGPAKPVVTFAIIAINAAMFLLTGLSNAGADSALGRLESDLLLRGRLVLRSGEIVDGIGVAGGEWWRLISGGFLHASILHIGFNMYLAYQIGGMLERQLGRSRYVVLYFGALLGGSLGVMMLDPESNTVGASGAVFGLMGALMVIQKAAGMNPFSGGIGPLVGINLLLTFTIPNISVGGHMGGLIAGAMLALLMVNLDTGSKPGKGTALAAALSVVYFVAAIFFAGFVA